MKIIMTMQSKLDRKNSIITVIERDIDNLDAALALDAEALGTADADFIYKYMNGVGNYTPVVRRW